MSEMTRSGYSLDDEQDYTINKSASASPGGSDTQVQFNDGGAFGGDAAFTWNKTTKVFKAGDDGGASGVYIQVDGTNGRIDCPNNPIFEVTTTSGAFIGDHNYDSWGNEIEINFNGFSNLTAPFNPVNIGDPNAYGNSTQFVVDDANQVVTSNVPVEVPDEAYGAGWNGSLEVPTKNALYDKIETLGGSGLTQPQVMARTVFGGPF